MGTTIALIALFLWAARLQFSKASADEFSRHCQDQRRRELFLDNKELGMRLVKELSWLDADQAYVYVESMDSDRGPEPRIVRCGVSAAGYVSYDRLTLEEAEAQLNKLIADKHRAKCKK